ncbi:hypothetical protein OR571_21915 [Psychrobacillus sp. NEAU-3TGS]|nr:hypothetical protein [Psychrobacillus sp. NEAU-3TGS]MDI2589686.1 hypothetical protein [Psychrobacillus sp. NEAU-3TGS]
MIFVVVLMIIFIAASYKISRVQAESLDEEDLHHHILHNTKPPK